MYAAIVKNGEPINGIKAGEPGVVVFVVQSRYRDTKRRFYDGAKSFRNFALRRVTIAE